MRVYIAGKITGDKDFKEKFELHKQQLTTIGYDVLSPADLPNGLTRAEYMRLCFAMIEMSDIVILLDDYINSPGALLELEFCKYIGKHYIGRDNAWK